jgi:hypothetical protein
MFHCSAMLRCPMSVSLLNTVVEYSGVSIKNETPLLGSESYEQPDEPEIPTSIAPPYNCHSSALSRCRAKAEDPTAPSQVWPTPHLIA